jgi:hypothetical protein
MQYDFALTPLGGQIINAKGRFFKYRAGTGLIRVKLTDGAVIDLLPGQGVSNRNFETIEITDKSGAVNAGSILAGDFDFRDERITGTVDIVDGGRARVIANQAFFGSTELVAGGAGAAAQAQLWNKSTNKRVIIQKICVSSATAGAIGFGQAVAQLPTLAGSAGSKHVGSPASASVETRTNTAVGGLVGVGTQFGTVFIQANVSFIYKLNEPVVLEPSTGFGVWHGLTNVDLRVFFEFFEEPL